MDQARTRPRRRIASSAARPSSRPADASDECSLRLNDQLCFALYAASRAVTNRYRPLLEPLGLTYPQYLVMLALWESDEPVTIKTLGRVLCLDYGTLTPMLKRLGEAGLVVRRRSDVDERTVFVALTPAGRELRERAEDVPCSIGRAMALDPRESATVMRLVRSLTDSVVEDTRA